MHSSRLPGRTCVRTLQIAILLLEANAAARHSWGRQQAAFCLDCLLGSEEEEGRASFRTDLTQPRGCIEELGGGRAARWHVQAGGVGAGRAGNARADGRGRAGRAAGGRLLRTLQRLLPQLQRRRALDPGLLYRGMLHVGTVFSAPHSTAQRSRSTIARGGSRTDSCGRHCFLAHLNSASEKMPCALPACPCSYPMVLLTSQ